MSNVTAVTVANFEREVLQAAEPVVVDFWADWCQPCKMLSPVLDKVANTYQGKVKVVKCDIMANQEIAQMYGVSAIPNLIFFKSGQVVDQAVGFVNENQLSSKVQQVIS